MMLQSFAAKISAINIQDVDYPEEDAVSYIQRDRIVSRLGCGARHYSRWGAPMEQSGSTCEGGKCQKGSSDVFARQWGDIKVTVYDMLWLQSLLLPA